jgi:hypothetical protein
MNLKPAALAMTEKTTPLDGGADPETDAVVVGAVETAGLDRRLHLEAVVVVVS